MSSPGYRNTAPVKLYMEFSREALENLEDGNFTDIQDPFDLRNTLVSFDYALASKKDAGLFKVKLINPSQDVEEKLFSWYCSVNPRTWRASEVATAEEWSFSAGQAATVYLRWGYQNDTIDRDAEVKNAFSHIHQAQVIDIEFNVSDRKERVLVLFLQNQHAISVDRNAQKRQEGNVSTYRVPLFEDGSIRPVADITSEMLGTIAAGEGIESFVFLSDEHKQTLNEEFARIHPGANREAPTPEEQATTPPRDRVNPNSTESRQITLDVIQQFFEYLDIGTVVDLTPPPPPDFVVTTPSLYQNGLGGGQTDALATDRLRRDALFSETEEFMVSGTLGAGMIDRNTSNPFANYFPGLATPGVGEAPILRYVVIPEGDVSKSLGSFTLNSLEQTYLNGKVRLLPLPENPSHAAKVISTYEAVLPTSVFTQTNLPGTFSREQFLARTSPVDPEAARAAGPETLYDLGSNPKLDENISIFLENLYARRDELLNENLDDDTLQQMQVLQETLEQASSGQPPEPVEPADNRSYVSVTCSDKYAYLNALINALNETFFDSAGEYIAMRYLQTSVVPLESRSEVEAVIGQVNWDDCEAICMIGSLSEIQRALEFNRKIRSFPIQVEGSPEIISLATGFNQRKDNIVVSVEHRVSKTSFYNTILNMPIIAPKLYSIAKRFESQEYRDVVADILGITLVTSTTTDANPDPVLLPESGNIPRGIIESRYYKDGIPISDNVKLNNRTISSEAFPAELVDKSLSQVSRVVNGLDREVVDSALDDVSVAETKRQIAEELTFIRDKGFMDIFFPFISGDSLASTQQRMYIDGEEVTKESSFRFVTNAPLSVLQKKLSADSGEEAVVMAAKLRSLFAFKKNIVDVKVKILGVPEMDILAYESGNRECALWISEPRVPGTYHWLTGKYLITDVTHSISADGAYTSVLNLIPAADNTADEMLKYSYAFLTND